MGIDGLAFAIKEAFTSVRRNGVMSAVAITTVAISLALLAFMVSFSINLYHMADMWESQVHLRVDIDREADADLIEELRLGIEMTEAVTEVTFVSREESLERLKKQFGQQKDLLAGLEGGQNPLPHSFEVMVTPPQRTQEVAEQIVEMPGVTKVKFGEDIVDMLFSLTAGVRWFGVGLLLVMAAGATFIIYNTIRAAVFSRRQEVGIMKLVGATDAMIRGPFLIEGMVLGLIGALLASGAAWSVYSWIHDATKTHIPFLPMVEPSDLLTKLAIGLMFVGSVIGAIGSGLSLRKYLRV